MKKLKYAALALLLIGGLVHLLPNTLTPLFEMGFGMITIQRIVGLFSVMIAVWLLVAPEKE